MSNKAYFRIICSLILFDICLYMYNEGYENPFRIYVEYLNLVS